MCSQRPMPCGWLQLQYLDPSDKQLHTPNAIDHATVQRDGRQTPLQTSKQCLRKACDSDKPVTVTNECHLEGMQQCTDCAGLPCTCPETAHISREQACAQIKSSQLKSSLHMICWKLTCSFKLTVSMCATCSNVELTAFMICIQPACKQSRLPNTQYTLKHSICSSVCDSAPGMQCMHLTT